MNNKTMKLPVAIRATDLGEFCTDSGEVGEDDPLICCFDPDGPEGGTIEPHGDAMALMREMARRYNACGKSKGRAELVRILSAIATVLEAPRDRLGRLDIEHGTPAGDAREVLRNLAIKFRVTGSTDTMHQCALVARAAMGESRRKR